MPPRKFTMKKKNGKKLKGGIGIFGFDISEMIGLKPKDSKIAPEVGASSSGQQHGQQSGQQHGQQSGQQPGQTLGSNNKIEGGKKRRSQKKSKTQKKKR